MYKEDVTDVKGKELDHPQTYSLTLPATTVLHWLQEGWQVMQCLPMPPEFKVNEGDTYVPFNITDNFGWSTPAQFI